MESYCSHCRRPRDRAQLTPTYYGSVCNPDQFPTTNCFNVMQDREARGAAERDREAESEYRSMTSDY